MHDFIFRGKSYILPRSPRIGLFGIAWYRDLQGGAELCIKLRNLVTYPHTPTHSVLPPTQSLSCSLSHSRSTLQATRAFLILIYSMIIYFPLVISSSESKVKGTRSRFSHSPILSLFLLNHLSSIEQIQMLPKPTLPVRYTHQMRPPAGPVPCSL